MNKTLIAASVLLLSMGAFADEYGSDADPVVEAAFSLMDTNGDGVISPDEAQADAELIARFDEVDAAGDGVITLEEFTIYMAR